ncbi:MAG: iron-containing alcohol dehydrogenase, partial [Armatimonadetes bacterium]|nr:iron-containing alcohol dehydrogenase [Armatimonadota bacterium]
FAAAIAVGAGTINDLVKLAAHEAQLPYGVVATAASMNGYTSAIAAIYSEGLKRTLPARPPLWVVGDTEVLAAAPPDMTRAGLADLMSKPSSTADWRAASWLLGEYFCPFCASVADQAETVCRQAAAEIGRCEPEAVELLFAGLLLSGLSMAMAGSSAPASGGEHLISHVWDMKSLVAGRHHALHGAQAGVGTLVCAALWQLLRELDPPDQHRIAAIVKSRRPWDEEVVRIRQLLGPQLAGPAVEEYRAKRPDDAALVLRLSKLSGGWHEFWGELLGILRPVTVLRETLITASAPTTAAELGFTAEEMREAFAAAKYIRRRYTVHDLATDLGMFDELFEPALELSGVLR